MFALEIDYHDGISSPEIVLIRRPSAIVGTSEFAHVLVEGGSVDVCELRITRGLGREFTCEPLRRSPSQLNALPFLQGAYQENAAISLGGVSVQVHSLDIDLLMKDDESEEQAGLRVFRQALSKPVPLFPAVAVLGVKPVLVSFSENEPLLIGRSAQCALQLDASDVSSQHARVGITDGELWVEDLGSTNGTFCDGERISGRQKLKAENLISLGSEIRLRLVRNPQDIVELNSEVVEQVALEDEFGDYPCLFTQSPLVKPSRFLLRKGVNVRLGRDPASDVWVGAPHISRVHAEISMDMEGNIFILDRSSNGVTVNGVRPSRGERTFLSDGTSTIDLGGGVILGVCRSQTHEREFLTKTLSQSSNENSKEGQFGEYFAEVDASYQGQQGVSDLGSDSLLFAERGLGEGDAYHAATLHSLPTIDASIDGDADELAPSGSSAGGAVRSSQSQSVVDTDSNSAKGLSVWLRLGLMLSLVFFGLLVAIICWFVTEYFFL